MSRPAHRSWLALSVLALLAGCANPGAPLVPAAVIAPAAAGLGDVTGAFPSARWWAALGDPALDSLVDTALAGQPGLQAAAARLVAADALLAAVQANQGPQAALGGDITRQRFSGNGLVPPAVAGSLRNTATLQATGHVALDFFGRHDAALGAAIGQKTGFEFPIAPKRSKPYHSGAIGIDAPRGPSNEYRLMMLHELAKAVETLKLFD